MIALADCDAFYVSCERVFRPDLARRAVSVLTNNDGCVIARSPELKALGAAMLAPDETATRQLLEQLPLTEIWGVAGRTARKLEALGIQSA
ncbi:hypothetical protein [Modicisalibacter sp. MOD 31.J]|uniref:Y-family DNA polymerase n=1 Tax=Modicisalibacter sp. MOD 31.J TaxID=2831897 RepID=UPI001CCC2FB4|nr:hypothetical protein [Modicisalibacter sp. MOD 31.J]